jgi:hypothetical protein
VVVFGDFVCVTRVHSVGGVDVIEVDNTATQSMLKLCDASSACCRTWQMTLGGQRYRMLFVADMMTC